MSLDANYDTSYPEAFKLRLCGAALALITHKVLSKPVVHSQKQAVIKEEQQGVCYVQEESGFW